VLLFGGVAEEGRNMRSAVLMIVLAVPTAAVAQNSAGWQKVQALPAGTKVQVKTGKHKVSCKVQSVSADSISCASGENIPRAEIASIKVSHRAASTLVGAGIGAGAAAGIGAGLNNSDQNSFLKFSNGEVAGVFAIAGAVIGAPIGFFTDFAKSTVYRGP
jgi:hypothetical protein